MARNGTRTSYDFVSAAPVSGSVATLRNDVLDCEVSGGGGAAFARGIYAIPGGIPVTTTLSVTMSVYLDPGYYAAKEDWSDLLRLDSYVDDRRVSTSDDERQYLSLSSWSNDTWHVQYQSVGEEGVDLIGPLPTSLLSEGEWHTVTLNIVYGDRDGTAFTELLIDGVSVGSSTDRNYDPEREAPNSVRFGIVSTGPGQTGTFSLSVDDPVLTYGSLVKPTGPSGKGLRLIGDDGPDLLRGGDGSDVLDGRHGRDTMIGGAGNDTYVVDAHGDRVVETTDRGSGIDAGGTDTVRSRASFDLDGQGGVRFVENLILEGRKDIDAKGNDLSNRLVGNSGDNVLRGDGGQDVLVGGRGSDRLVGGGGSDRLVGGGGRDVFVFRTEPGPGAVDRIEDFDVGRDRIRLDEDIFDTLPRGSLAARAFSADPTGRAGDATDRILYETDTGRLYFDTDGTGAARPIHFATLDAGLDLTAADIFVF